MFRFMNFILTLMLIATLVCGGYWYLVTPQPAKLRDQMRFATDTILFQIQYVQKSVDTPDTWRAMAREGNSAAQLHQAQLLFVQAKNNPNSYQEAFAVLRLLAEKGIPEGQNALGVILRDGLTGAAPDKIEAYKWFSLAASRGYDLGEKNVIDITHTMSAAEILEAQNRASSWTLFYLDSKQVD